MCIRDSSRGDQQEPTFYSNKRRDNERMKEKRFTPYPGNKPQNQQEVEEKGRSRSVENKSNKGYKVRKTP